MSPSSATVELLARFPGPVAISGRTSGLPDTYGLAADDLANLMEQWHGRALEWR
jgi:hypothetical protein